MKRLILIALLALLIACEPDAAQPTPDASETATRTPKPTETKPAPTVTGTATRTAMPDEHYLPAGFAACEWTSNQENAPLYNDHYSGSTSGQTIPLGSVVEFTGYFVDYWWDVGLFAELRSGQWVRLTNEMRTAYYFETDGDCTLQARPIPTVEGSVTTTPAPQQGETWTLLQRILPTNEPLTALSVRNPVGGVCSASGSVVRTLAYDAKNDANNRFVLSADSVTSGGNEYRVIRDGIYAGKCIAVKSSALTFMVRVG